MIQGFGFSSPEVIFIADKPAGSDIQTNYALTGYGGKILGSLCRKAGLDIDNFYRTCLIKEPVPEADFQLALKDKKNKLNELTAPYGEILVNEINALAPYLLVPLGEASFRFVTGLKGIRKFRGSVLPTIPTITTKKVLPILGPYPYLNQEPALSFISQLDFKKIPKYLNNDPVPESRYNIWVARNITALRAFVDRSFGPAEFVVFDIETYMQIPTCISLCFDGNESVCVPIIDNDLDIETRALMLDIVARVLASDKPKINQNIKYDWKILERWGLRVNNVVGDTMLAANCLYCEFPKNLGFLTSIYTDLPYFKDEGKKVYDPALYNRNQFYMYNAKDSLAVHQIYTKQKEELIEVGVKNVYDNLVKLMPIYKRLETTGILIDQAERLALTAKYETLRNIELGKLKVLLNRQYVNTNSPKQMGTIIFEELGYERIRGVEGTDEDSLELLKSAGNPKTHRRADAIDIIDGILNCRKIDKVLQILSLKLYPDGRFRGEYNIVGTKNGRTSSSKTTDELLYFEEDDGTICSEDLGYNFQSIGKHGFMMNGQTYGTDVRRMFVADAGFSLVNVDLSQAEARVDAVLANCFHILQIFDGPVGIHRLTGSWVYGCPPEEIKKNILVDGVDRYHMAKTVRHAGERNMGAMRLVQMTSRPLRECEQILSTFHKYQPEIRSIFHAEVIKEVSNNRALRSPNGRNRFFFGRLDNATFNEAISYLPQAIVGDQMKFSFAPALEKMPQVRLLIESHDAILALVPKNHVNNWIVTLGNELTRSIDFRKCSLKRDFELVIPYEAEVGPNWLNLEEVKL